MRIFEMAREKSVIESIAATLAWDQETYMPRKAAAHRADQRSWVSSRAHEMGTSEKWKRALEEAEAADEGTDPKITANLRLLRREFDRDTCLPTELVARETAACSKAKHAWAEARAQDDFQSFAPHLQTQVDIAREKAELWGYQGEPYDALLEEYERATSTAAVAELFEALAPRLREIAQKAIEKSADRATNIPAGPYPVAEQQAFNAKIAEAVGIDFNAARIDTTAHPFCTKLGPGDQRLTTRYDEADFTSSLFGVLHEAGHGLYEMGLPQEDFGLPSGSSVSLGIHESQSRLWENQVGRSRRFWEHWYPSACEHFSQLNSLPLDDFLAYVQRAEFIPIRVEADEATYDLHIMLRFDIERQLINSELKVGDVPECWNASFEESFGFRPPSDREGCLQDIHWSMGGIGYFPTYSLGNLNAAQLFASATTNDEISAGLDKANYAPLLQWLRSKVHHQGALLDPVELMIQATGKAPAADDYLKHLENRYL